MDWTNERYVRVYVRDTADLLAVGWEGRAVLWEMMRKADRAGVVDGDEDTLPDLLRMPREVVEVGIAALIKRQVVVVGDLGNGRGYLIRNFLDAQEAKQSDAQRQRESRARRRDSMRGVVTKRDEHLGCCEQSVTNRDEKVTRSHTVSQPVTPSLAVPSHAVRKRAPARVATTTPPPQQDEREQAVCEGCDDIAECGADGVPAGWADGLCPECQRHEAAQPAKPPPPPSKLGTAPMNPVARQLAEHIRTHRRFDSIDAGEIGNSNAHLVETGGKSLTWLKEAIDECNRDAGSAAAAKRPWSDEVLAQKLGRYLWKARRPEPSDSGEEVHHHPPLFVDDGPRPTVEQTRQFAAEALAKFRAGRKA